MLRSHIALAITSLRSRVVFLNMSKKKESRRSDSLSIHTTCVI